MTTTSLCSTLSLQQIRNRRIPAKSYMKPFLFSKTTTIHSMIINIVLTTTVLLLVLEQGVVFMNRNHVMNPLKYGFCHGFTLRTNYDHRLRLMYSYPQQRSSSTPSFFVSTSRRKATTTTTTTSIQSATTSSSATAKAGTAFPAGDSQATNTKKKVITRRILSGVQPTGTLHLGNYLGAIRQWVDFQNNDQILNQIIQQQQQQTDGTDNENDQNDDAEIRTENYFCVVDLHAITLPHDPKALYESTLSSAALYIAAGIDPAKSKIFIQSHVPEHTELTWLLNCITPMNWLERMIQYKDKSKKTGSDNVGVGLFSYPILMASDILLYQATHVPVGEDQRQHLELTRDIVRRFLDIFTKGSAYKKRCKEFNINSRPPFIEPNAIIMKDTGRIMSLTDGTNKMSKSDPNDNSRINLLDSPDLIQQKIKRCKTDEFIGIEYNNPNRPEATNLLNIYMAVHPNGTTVDGRHALIEQVKDMTWGEFKPTLSKALIEHLQPIQEKYHTIRSDESYLRTVLSDGAQAASIVASETLFKTRVAMGFVIPTKSS